jgi:hypothetical protein
LAAVFAAALLTACGSDHKDVTSPPVAASIVVSSASGSIPVAGTMQFSAVVKDADGNVIDLTPTWSVVNGGGTISTSGLFTAGDTAGTYLNTIKATVGSVSSTGSVTVNSGELASITISPDTASLAAGATHQFTAVGKDAHGNVITFSPSWSATAGGTIDTAGLFTAGTTAGAFAQTIVATSGSISDSASVTVLAGELASITLTPTTKTLVVGDTAQFTAVGKDANNNIVDVTPVWTVAASGGTISSTGLFTADTVAGEFANTVTATSGTVSATASIVVSPGALNLLTITPASQTLAIHATQQFSVGGTDAYGNAVEIDPVWQVLNGGGSINSSTGLFTAGGSLGTFAHTVVVTSGTVAATADITVTAGPLASITVSPSNPNVHELAFQSFIAVGKDADGHTVSITPVWSIASGSSSAGTINSSTGSFHASTHSNSYHNAIVATVGSIKGNASVNVYNH